MLSVPWCIGWALRPYIQINGAAATTTLSQSDDATSSAARAQVAQLSSPSAARKPASSTPSPTSPTAKPYPVVTQPVTTKAVKPQAAPAQQAAIAKTTATKTAAAAPTTTPKQVPGSQGKPASGPGTLVSTKTITLTMSAEWAQRQLEQFRFSFDEADRDKSGFLSLDEVFNVISKNGFKGSKDEAKQLFAHLDVNNDQKLTRDEFSSALDKLPRVTIKEFVLRKTFLQMDKDGSGTLTRTEIEDATKSQAGLDIAAEKIADLLIALSKDTKDDVVDYEEFLRVFGVHGTASVMHDVFTKLDTDRSGYLNKQEILKAVEAESELKLRAAKISDLLIAWHKDADKKINYEEFVQVWTKYKD